LALTQEVKKMLSPEQRQQMDSMMMQMGPMMGPQSKKDESGETSTSAPGSSNEGSTGEADPHGH
jgi:hypothetical protein